MDGGILPGTPIATFLIGHGRECGVYANGTIGREKAGLDHAAKFMGYVRDKNNKIVGFTVLEQYKGSGGVHQHTYMANGSGGERDAMMYRAIKDTSGRYLGGENNPMVGTANLGPFPQSPVFGHRGRSFS